MYNAFHARGGASASSCEGSDPSKQILCPRAGDAVEFAPRGWPNSCQEEASVLRGGVYPRVYDVGSITSV